MIHWILLREALRVVLSGDGQLVGEVGAMHDEGD